LHGHNSTPLPYHFYIIKEANTVQEKR